MGQKKEKRKREKKMMKKGLIVDLKNIVSLLAQ